MERQKRCSLLGMRDRESIVRRSNCVCACMHAWMDRWMYYTGRATCAQEERKARIAFISEVWCFLQSLAHAMHTHHSIPPPHTHTSGSSLG
jgi:hypothetical protein